MRGWIRWTAQLLGLVLLACASTRGASERDALGWERPDSPVQGVEAFTTLLRRAEFRRAADAFHYPPQYTSAELKGDKAAISLALEIVTGELGAPEGTNLIQRPDDVVIFAMQSASSAYWSGGGAPRGAETVPVSTTYARAGRGYLMLRFVEFEGGWEIRSVQFGLPAKHPGAAERIDQLKGRVSSALAGG